jgi:hypothetical protein
VIPNAISRGRKTRRVSQNDVYYHLVGTYNTKNTLIPGNKVIDIFKPSRFLRQADAVARYIKCRP